MLFEKVLNYKRCFIDTRNYSGRHQWHSELNRASNIFRVRLINEKGIPLELSLFEFNEIISTKSNNYLHNVSLDKTQAGTILSQTPPLQSLQIVQSFMSQASTLKITLSHPN